LPSVVARRTEYRHEYGFYCQAWGIAERTLKRWVAVGRKSQDPPPLDRPELLPSWWSRHYDRRAPDELLAAAGIQATKQQAADSPRLLAAPEPREPVVIPADLPAGPAGIQHMVGRLREAETTAQARYQELVRQNADAGSIELARKGWLEVGERLRQAERTAVDVLKKHGELVERRRVEAVLVEIHGAIAGSVRSMGRRLADRLGVSWAQPMEEAWNAECDRVFSGLREGSFRIQVDS